MNSWLTEELKSEIKKVFEPRYNRKLSKQEILQIAFGLTSYIENASKFRWRVENAN